MNLLYAEDYNVGDQFDLGKYEVTREEIIEFSRKYDPFRFHVDDKAAQSTIFGGIISSGWLTALVCLRLMHKAFFLSQTFCAGMVNKFWNGSQKRNLAIKE